MSFSLEINNYQNSHFYSKIYFLLCESCFWCASRFVVDKKDDNNVRGHDVGSYGDYNNNGNNNNKDTNSIRKCPVCDKEKVESMPIAIGELYRFDYNLNRGVTLEFF
jgi:hypothetical protein